MKKFLSLVLALIMTFSLVTIGAGATEYKDLTDKSEITYEEAVAVLNKLGIISGYSDGSFNPTGTLTRGAAAKIIVSLMIGTEAASNLAVNAAPYSDVPANHTFAGVISYCKTAGYINGYTDGTFRPADPLTGYAFAKMLLGALGYDGVQEKFSGLGWTMNVNKLGNEAGLFRDFVEGFKGNNGVTREEACLLALNTLKATEVEYSGGTSITTSTGDATTSVVTNKERSYKSSNDAKINKNIQDKKSINYGNLKGTESLEFAEEHFPNLTLRSDGITDDYGRPANRWALKNVEIGTYAKIADYTYTAAPSGDTPVDKVKDMGLKDYSYKSTTLTVNGWEKEASLADGKTTTDGNAKTLTNYAKNGALVQVYLDEDDSNIIKYVAVTQTQIMKINRVTSKDVTFKTVEKQGIKADGTAVAVSTVKSDDAVYSALKDLKANDYVVVTPLADSKTAGSPNYSVDAVFIPTTATGTISNVKVNSLDNNTSAVTLGGTEYKMSKNWTAEDADGTRTKALNGTSVNTKRESTAYLDSYGYAIYVGNVQASTSYFLFDESYSTIVDGRIHYYAQGWDTKGTAVSLDFGTKAPNFQTNMVYAYKNATSSTADYEWDSVKQANVYPRNTNDTGTFKADQTNIGGTYFKSGVKFIFSTMDTDNSVETVTIKTGSQKIDKATTPYQYVVESGKISAVFVKSDDEVEVSQNVLYVQKQTHETTVVDGNKHVSLFTAYINGEKQTDLRGNKTVEDDTFYTYSVSSDNVYTVNAYHTATGKATSVLTSAVFKRADLSGGKKAYLDGKGSTVKPAGTVEYLDINGAKQVLGTNLDLSDAKVIDLRDGGTISSASDIADSSYEAFRVSLVYNDSSSSANHGRVAYVYILKTGTYAELKLSGSGDKTETVTMTLPSYLQARVNGGEWTTGSVQIPTGKTGTDAKVEFKALDNGTLFKMKIPAGFTDKTDGTATDGDGTKTATNGVVALYVLKGKHTGASYALRDLAASRVAYAGAFVEGLTKNLTIGTETDKDNPNWVGGWYVVPGSVNINKTNQKLTYTLRAMYGDTGDTAKNGSAPTSTDLNKLIAAVMKDDAKFEVVRLYSDGKIQVEMDGVTYEIATAGGTVSTPTDTLPVDKTEAAELNDTRSDELIENVTAPVVDEDSMTEATVRVEADNVTDISKAPNSVDSGAFPIYKDEYNGGSDPIYNDPGEKSAIIAVKLGDLINAIAGSQQDAKEEADAALEALNGTVTDLITEANTAKAAVTKLNPGSEITTAMATFATKLTAVQNAADVAATATAEEQAVAAGKTLTEAAASASDEIKSAVAAYVAYAAKIGEAKEAAITVKVELVDVVDALFFNTSDGRNNDTKLACILTSPGLKCYWKEGGYKDGQITCRDGVYTKRINNNSAGATLTAYKNADLAIQILESQTEATLGFYAVSDVTTNAYATNDAVPKFTLTIDLTGINFA